MSLFGREKGLKVEPHTFGVHFNGDMTQLEDGSGNTACCGEVPGWMNLVNSTACSVTWKKPSNSASSTSDSVTWIKAECQKEIPTTTDTEPTTNDESTTDT